MDIAKDSNITNWSALISFYYYCYYLEFELVIHSKALILLNQLSMTGHQIIKRLKIIHCAFNIIEVFMVIYLPIKNDPLNLISYILPKKVTYKLKYNY